MNRGRRNAWDAALSIIRELRAKGHVALLAGGCVRDRMLGLEPQDYDVATDAKPSRVAELFPKARHVGAKFGVMIVRRLGHDIEVATFRHDGAYVDGRRPQEVSFGTEQEDALRRDFTINGLFHDPIGDRIIDHVGGRADIVARIIRTIGDPMARFGEDHLRMLRAVRFAARLGFELEPSTFEAIRESAAMLELISPERIWLELEAILTGRFRPAGWALLLQTGLRKHLSKDWAAEEQEDSLNLRRLAALGDDTVSSALGLSAVLCAREPGHVAGICRALRLSNRRAGEVLWLVRSLPFARNETALELADVKTLMADENWENLLVLLRADLEASGADWGPYERLRARAADVGAADVAPPPLVTGDDLCSLGFAPGPKFGEVLSTIYRAQLNGRISTRDEALEYVRRELALLR